MSTSGQREPVGITMGCPVGIGPEIILKFFTASLPRDRVEAVVLGDIRVLGRMAGELGIDIPIVAWQPGDEVVAGTLPVLDLSALAAEKLTWGRPDARTGRAMAGYIEAAAKLVRGGYLAAMVTCPISKYALNLAGYDYPGHTEMLAALTDAGEYAMMMAGERLRVTLVTIHEPLARVPGLIHSSAVSRMIGITARALRHDFGLKNPRIAVAALNPHAGESGMFGNEEAEIIAPAVEECARRWQVSGPCPPDTVFLQAAQGRYDCVVAMYHDQGLIPFKLLHFEDGVNVTLGLPIIRTSVDHGTGYDIAGRGRANPASLIAACRLAAEIAVNRSDNGG